MRETMLPGWKREYLASKAWTQPSAADSKALAWASPPGAVYCTSHWVAIARKASFRSGRMAPWSSAPARGPCPGGTRSPWLPFSNGRPRRPPVRLGLHQFREISTEEIWKFAFRSAGPPGRPACGELLDPDVGRALAERQVELLQRPPVDLGHVELERVDRELAVAHVLGLAARRALEARLAGDRLDLRQEPGRVERPDGVQLARGRLGRGLDRIPVGEPELLLVQGGVVERMARISRPTRPPRLENQTAAARTTEAGKEQPSP
jgi:hypothetical protein